MEAASQGSPPSPREGSPLLFSTRSTGPRVKGCAPVRRCSRLMCEPQTIDAKHPKTNTTASSSSLNCEPSGIPISQPSHITLKSRASCVLGPSVFCVASGGPQFGRKVGASIEGWQNTLARHRCSRSSDSIGTSLFLCFGPSSCYDHPPCSFCALQRVLAISFSCCSSRTT